MLSVRGNSSTICIRSWEQVKVRISPTPLANADNFDTGCRFLGEKFCEGVNRSAKV